MKAYEWNVERNAAIIKKLEERLPPCLIAFQCHVTVNTVYLVKSRYQPKEVHAEIHGIVKPHVKILGPVKIGRETSTEKVNLTELDRSISLKIV